MENSETQCQLEELHGGQRNGGEDVEKHVQYVNSLPNSLGVSDHDLLFTQRVERTEAPTEAVIATRISRGGSSKSSRGNASRYGTLLRDEVRRVTRLKFK